ncbi:hypothetical protein D3C73_978160 [compost metagenome]
MSRLGAVNVDPHEACGLRSGESGFGVLHIGNQIDAAAVVGLAVQGRADMARRTLEQTHAEPGLQPLHCVGDGRAGQAQVFGRLGEAASLHDPGEDAHRIEPIHCSCFRIVMSICA